MGSQSSSSSSSLWSIAIVALTAAVRLALLGGGSSSLEVAVADGPAASTAEL